MSEMVERVARAIWPDAFEGDGAGWHQRRDVARDQARAAIEAMREPTLPMLCALWDDTDQVKELWHAMIDEALK